VRAREDAARGNVASEGTGVCRQGAESTVSRGQTLQIDYDSAMDPSDRACPPRATLVERVRKGCAARETPADGFLVVSTIYPISFAAVFFSTAAPCLCSPNALFGGFRTLCSRLRPGRCQGRDRHQRADLAVRVPIPSATRTGHSARAGALAQAQSQSAPGPRVSAHICAR
jgi:hypothetical protein